MWIVRFKDGDQLHMDARHCGPFNSFSEAYDYLCNLPAPTHGGFKCIEQLESSNASIVSDLIADARKTREINNV